MKDIRPFQLILLAGFGFLGFAGLFFFATFNGNKGESMEAGTVTIWGTLQKDAVEAAIAEIIDENSAFADVAYVQKQEKSYAADIANALASGSGPDLIILSQEDLLSQKAKLNPIPFTSLPERTFVDRYVPIFELFIGADGAYGVPLVVDPVVLYYNRTMLSSAGVATPPTNWEAVSGMAPSISVRDDAGTIFTSLIPLGEYTNVQNARSILSLLLLQSGSPITTAGDRNVSSVLTENASGSSFGATPAESAVNFYTQFADPAKTVYSWNRALPNSRQVFLAGDMAFYPGHASELSFLMNANPNLDFDMAAIPQPGTGGPKVTYAKAYAAVLPKTSDNQSGALRTAYALSGERAMKALSGGLGMAPASRALLTPKADDRYSAIVYPAALISKGWLSPGPAAVDGVFSAMIDNISTGRKDVEDALRGASSSLDSLLRAFH